MFLVVGLNLQSVRLPRDLVYKQVETHVLMKKRICIFALISSVFGFLLVWLFYPNEEEQILAQFEELSDIASKQSETSTIADALVLDDFKNLFAPDVSLKTGGRARLTGQYTDQELMQLYGRIRLQSKWLGLRFENIEILSVGETDATTTADINAEGTDNIRDPNRVESFHAKIHLRKIDGDWKFRQFIYIESLPGK